ncbi:MAG: class I SAM-dependent methyltransferase [Kiritimatiellae bacterium]|nr:class I SAM-dependent methyltransferase [Kiritimatiellia bacterium]MDW8458475.1 class I SAM-dependent methyltransferase [Verrucomicrobiota bacterium]
MAKDHPGSAPSFDGFARQYDEALHRGLVLSGETKEFFARERIRILRNVMQERAFSPRRILDFGCGTGGSIRYLLEIPGVQSVTGVDVSEASLSVAAAVHPHVRFCPPHSLADDEQFDLIFANGVFHHIQPGDRPSTLAWIRRRLAPGGWFVLWENNPWNIGTRWVMKRIPFDRDAIPLYPRATRRMLRANGFQVVDQSFWFIFPAWLKFFRPLEPCLSRCAMGAQYQTVSVAA